MCAAVLGLFSPGLSRKVISCLSSHKDPVLCLQVLPSCANAHNYILIGKGINKQKVKYAHHCFFSNDFFLLLALSPALTAVLYDLSRQIPQLKKDIQDGLLKMLSLVLMHKPLRHPGMPKGLAHQLASPSLTNIPEASDVGSITLALRTLGSFEFEGKME